MMMPMMFARGIITMTFTMLSNKHAPKSGAEVAMFDEYECSRPLTGSMLSHNTTTTKKRGLLPLIRCEAIAIRHCGRP